MVTPEGHSLVGGAFCLDFSNTVSSYAAEERIDRINGYADLLTWSEHADMLPPETADTLRERADARPDRAQQVYKRAISVRETVFSVFSALAQGSSPQDSDLEVLNAALRESASHRVLHPSPTDQDAHPGVSWSWSPEDDLERPLWPIVQSAAELLTTSDARRIKMCGGQDCTWLFLDESRNRSRKWCDMETCGNRAKARRYRKKDES